MDDKELVRTFEEILVKPKDMTPFEVASCAIMACGTICYDKRDVTELEALEELVVLQKAEVFPCTNTFDIDEFEKMLDRRMKANPLYKHLFDQIKTDILDCTVFYKESSPGMKDL